MSARCRFCGDSDGTLVSELVDTGHRATTRFNRGDGRRRHVEVLHHQACRDAFEKANDEARAAELAELQQYADAVRVSMFLAGAIR